MDRALTENRENPHLKTDKAVWLKEAEQEIVTLLIISPLPEDVKRNWKGSLRLIAE